MAKSLHDWTWFYAIQEDAIYQKVNTQWVSFNRARFATRTNQLFSKFQNQTAPTGPLALTTILHLSDTIILFEGTYYTDIDKLTPMISLSCDSFWILKSSNIHHIYNQHWVAAGLQSCTLLAVCDGSYKLKLSPNVITAAFIMEGPGCTTPLSGHVTTSGI